MSTKKLLVAYDESRPTAGKGDFLAVALEGTTPVFFGLRSHQVYSIGRVVFIGREITENDIFAKLVNSGRKIGNVEETLKTLAAYLQQLAAFKVGNVVAITQTSSYLGFELVKLAEMPRIEVKRIP